MSTSFSDHTEKISDVFGNKWEIHGKTADKILTNAECEKDNLASPPKKLSKMYSPNQVDILKVEQIPSSSAGIAKTILDEIVVISALDLKYIIARSGSLVFAFDQHAVSERIMLEKLTANVSEIYIFFLKCN
jgi:DNA mismatch repair ATPase MutL